MLHQVRRSATVPQLHRKSQETQTRHFSIALRCHGGGLNVFDVPVCAMIREFVQNEFTKSTKSGGGQWAALGC